MITEGFITSGELRTCYRVVGNIRESYAKGLAPLVLLHGGPGSTHNYFELLDPLAESGRAIVMYDQLGCGGSFIGPRPELWVADTWVDELERVREHLGLKEIHLLGQSWGGMLAITYLCDRKPEGIKSIILSSTLSSSQLWGVEQHRNIRLMSSEDQDAIAAAEKSGDYTSPAYLEALDRFMARHCCDNSYGPDAPECLRRPKKSGSESYLVAWGPNEFTPQGTLAQWDYTDRLREIDSPALIISGTDDLCTPLVAKTMYDRLKDARWELFPGCRHMCFADDTGKYLSLVGSWMTEKD